ncbi:MAG: porin [Campylobacterales bacterium]|nr:porin [Campylobacterales bacterium]
MKKTTLALSATMLLASGLFADDKADIEMLKQQIKELQEITQTLTDETSDLKTGFNYTTVDKEKTFSGLSPAASKVYFSKSPLSIGGYGEMYYSNSQVDGATAGESKIDVYRFVPYIGYKFSDNIILNTELEFEHGGADGDPSNTNDGYVVIEFMYLDFLMNENFNVRVGNFLVPMGLVNEKHEPVLFNTVQRPNTEKNIIPSTWQENGAMVFGNITDDISYKVAMVTALSTGVNGSKWLRDGRGGSWTQKNPEYAGVARIDYTGINGLYVGASTYYGTSGIGEDSSTFMYDIHADYKNSGFRAYGIYTQAIRSKTNTIDATSLTPPTATKEANGGYINLSYDVLTSVQSEFSLPVFVQYESVNPQAKFADGTSYNPVNTTTIGVNFFPHEQVVLKADYAMSDNDYSNSKTNSDVFSLSMGFIF